MATQTTTKTKTTLSSSPSDLPNIQPFPDDITTAPLRRISLTALRKDPAESERFFQACKDLGFFYLDLSSDPEGQETLAEGDELFELSEQLFALGGQELSKYDYSAQGTYYGYKGFGQRVVDRKGTLDKNEFYNSPKDDFLGVSEKPNAHPNVLMDKADLIRSFMKHAHSITDLILGQLNSHLQLPEGTLIKIHKQSRPSGNVVRMIRAPPQDMSKLSPSMGAHTDYGSVTVLLNRVGGLQVLLPDAADNEWTYVRPLPGHAVINLGDAMVKFSNGLLRSNIHRVISPPGRQASETRYSLAYFSRPADDVLLKRLESSVIPKLADDKEEDINSKDWINQKITRTTTDKFAKGEIGKRRETGRLAVDSEVV